MNHISINNTSFTFSSSLGALFLLLFHFQSVSQTVFINELHYDNTGTDSLEGVEVFGPAGTDLSCYDIVLYNGANNETYNSVSLSGIIADEECGYGVIWFPIATIQNGNPDGLALVETCSCVGPCDNDDVVQFLSYEGTITAGNGEASGMTSTDIGVSEPGPDETSLQLTGVGTVYTDFTWTGPVGLSYDSLNAGQVVCPVVATQFTFASVSGGCTITDSIFSVIVCATDSAKNIDLTYSGTITIAIASGPGNIAGTLSVAAMSGCATFSDLSIDSASQYTLVASDGSLSNDTTGNISIADSCGKCIEIQSILVEACEPGPGLEGENEMVKFKVGQADLYTTDLFVDWPNNAWLGLCQNATTSDIIDSINANITGGGMVYEPVNGIIPVGADVILISSTNFDWATHDWAALNYDLCLLFQCAGNSSGHFKNNQGCPCGTRELVIQFTGWCSDTVTYSPDSLLGADGDGVDFDPPGNASYGNNGCKPPIFPFSIFLNTSSTTTSCNGACDGTATASATAGAPPFTYLWDDMGAQTDSVATGLCAGTFNVTVTDAASTVIIGTTLVLQPDTLDITFVSQTNVVCNGDSSGVSVITTSGGTSPMTYIWNDPGLQTDSVADSLPAGTFTIIVVDGNACSDTDSVTINEPVLLSVSITDSSDALCAGGFSGTANSAASGGTGPYTYEWDDPAAQTDSLATNLAAGPYMVVVTDSNGCTDSAAVTIGEPAPLTLSITDSLNVACAGDSTGSATVSASGGTTPYTYLWDDANAQTDSMATGLTAGTYTVSVTDADDCGTFASVVISEPGALALSFANTLAACGDSSGTSTVSVSGGIAPYNYVWSNMSAQTDSTATGLYAGTFSVTVTDDSGCAAVNSTVISQTVAFTLTSAAINVQCNGDSSGTAIVSTAGGSAPFTYAWSDPGVQTTANATGLPAGSYTVVVTDSAGCVDSSSVTVSEPSALGGAFTVTDASCNGDCDGSITGSPSGGTGSASSWSLIWNTGDTALTITTLCAGTYAVLMIDSVGCSAADSAQVTEPVLMSVTATSTDASCNGIADGTLSVTVTGGNAPLTYSWTGGLPPNPTHSVVSPGSYTVTVTDLNGCTAIDTAVVNEPSAMNLIVTPTPSICSNGGEAAVTVSGGTSPYTYIWDDPNGTTGAMIFVGAGTYTVTVTDANECSQTGSATVTNTPGPVLDSVVVTLETCIGESDALITVYVNSGIPPYTYTWDDPSLGATSTSQNVASGVYYLIVTDAQFCGTADTITVSPGLTDCEVEDSFNIPSSFTPNFDLTNDTWILRGISKYPNVTVEIYNRWGSLLYSSGGYAEPWDGTYQGKEVASATYYYIIILSENDEPITGSVTVVR